MKEDLIKFLMLIKKKKKRASSLEMLGVTTGIESAAD